MWALLFVLVLLVVGIVDGRVDLDPGAGGFPSSGSPLSPALPAGDELLRIVTDDDAFVQANLLDVWLPQVASGRSGMVVGGTTYTDEDLLARHEALRAAYPQVRLVWSSDYSSFTNPDHWVTVVATTFADAAEANAWCDQQGFPPTECHAKRLSYTGTPADNTVTRG